MADYLIIPLVEKIDAVNEDVILGKFSHV